MIIRTILLLVAFTAAVHVASAQKPTVKSYIQQVAKGWTSDAKKALPDLLIDQPDDPGVMFLHATLVEEPERALPLLERIVQNYPTNEWADDALTRVILYACLKKDAEKAKASFRKMRDLYSQSDLLPVAYDALRMSVGVPPPATAETSTPKAATPTTPAVAATAADTAKKVGAPVTGYTLATMTTENKTDADKLVDSFKKKRMRVRVTEKWIKGKRNYVVEVGEYATEVDAAKDIEAVRAICKCKPTVVKRS